MPVGVVGGGEPNANANVVDVDTIGAGDAASALAGQNEEAPSPVDAVGAGSAAAAVAGQDGRNEEASSPVAETGAIHTLRRERSREGTDVMSSEDGQTRTKNLDQIV